MRPIVCGAMCVPLRPARHRRSLGLAGVLLALTAVAPSAASAQIDPPISDPLGAVESWSTAESLRRLLPDGPSAGRENRKPPRRRARTPKPTRAQLAKLRFTRDPGVTEANNQAVIAKLGPGYDPATVVADIERNRTLAHDGLRSFEGRWSPDDLADIASFVLLTGYAAYHDRPELSSRGCLAVRRAARTGLATRKRIRRTSNADKQTAAEMSEIRMIYSLAALNAARMAGDGDAAEEARWEIRAWVRDVYGLDLERARLTSHGFTVS